MSDYETAQRRRNIIVGIFVIAAMCALVGLIYKFGDLPTAVSKFDSFPVFVQFPTAAGVDEDTPVRFCGYQIGRVTKVMAPEIRKDLNTGQEYHQTLVVLRIDREYVTIPAQVDVKLMTRGLGSSYIELKADPVLYEPNQPKPAEFLTDKVLLQGSTGMTSEFFPEESQKKLEQLVEGIRTFIKNANDILGDPNNKENIKVTLANLSETTDRAKLTFKKLQELSDVAATTLKNADTSVDKFVTAMIDTSEELSKTLVELRLVLEKVNTGQGAAAMLVNDARLYEALLENSHQLQVLLEKWTSFVDQVNKKGKIPISLK